MLTSSAMKEDPKSSQLRKGIEELGLLAPEGAMLQLLAYVGLLDKWNRAYNLTAVRDPRQMVVQHLLDCLSAVPALDRQLARADARLLDAGSGAGLPGLVLAVMRPRWSICCVDAVAKKSIFVRQVATELGLKNLQAEHSRVETLQLPPCDVVISRAFASLADFTLRTRHHLTPGGCWLAMKGKHPSAEIAALPAHVEVFHVEQLQVPGLDAQRCLVWMRPR
jgi:16S rRNA (guanine527-N7)-methyltransferase